MYAGWKATRVIALCSAANFINSADRVIMPIAIVQLTKQFGWNLHGQGWILSSFAVGYMASGVIGASAAKRFGGKNVLALAVFMWSLSTFITPWFAHSFYSLIFFRALLGFGEGLGLPTIFHIFSHTITVEERSRAFGYLMAMGSVGQTISSVVCPHLHWQWMFYLFGSLGFIWVIAWLSMYKEIRTSNTDEEYAEPPKVISANIPWSEFISHWPLWALYIAHFTMNWSNYIIMHWLPTYIHTNLNAKESEIMYTAIPYIMNSVVGVATAHIADNLIMDRKWAILSVRRLMTGIGLIGPGIFILLFSDIDNLFLAMLCVSISMGLSACNSSGHLSNHAEVAPSYAGTTFAISNTLGTMAGVLCGPLTAELVGQSGGRWLPVFVIAAFTNFVGGIIYISQSSASQII